ncbi:hypothetical protein CHLNCDRAFT_144775 [Chlorella variabilis]|uniref:Uncharacterized protein n=1 Tax=Chlorella variabilis TaxID=554065 RepID=E1ZCZ8_CHLVA|nr:hypothetical protein CHLNCDRAFT_144775 [Chlorella variabilis]EFN56327.1 hypothetical protein CHLNCDRAFT_144775 [Chlorella variabilis]|eukprot:XP_005848429.1 hypothetical protein CHLNCDRAFT_144775 [Chlorella variabilis]
MRRPALLLALLLLAAVCKGDDDSTEVSKVSEPLPPCKPGEHHHHWWHHHDRCEEEGEKHHHWWRKHGAWDEGEGEEHHHHHHEHGHGCKGWWRGGRHGVSKMGHEWKEAGQQLSSWGKAHPAWATVLLSLGVASLAAAAAALAAWLGHRRRMRAARAAAKAKPAGTSVDGEGVLPLLEPSPAACAAEVQASQRGIDHLVLLRSGSRFLHSRTHAAVSCTMQA